MKTAIEHLRVLIKAARYTPLDGQPDLELPRCFACGSRTDIGDNLHTPDCPWLAAKRYIEIEDMVGRPVEPPLNRT